MSSKNFIASNMSAALKQVKTELGPNAVIISQKVVDGQVHVVATDNLEEFNALPSNNHVSNFDAQMQLRKPASSDFASPLISTAMTRKTEEFETGFASQIRSDLNLIKDLLKSNLLNMDDNALSGNFELHSSILKKLYSKGFSKGVVNKVISNIDLEGHSDEIWHNVVSELVNLIPFDCKDPLTRKRILTFFGPSGAGKTQLIAKELIYLNERSFTKNFAFIFVNLSNLKVLDESKIYGRLFNVSSYYVESLAELENAYQRTLNKDYVFIDFPAFDFIKPSNNYYVEFVNKYADVLDNNLVISSSLKRECLLKYLTAHSFMNIDAISITKLDEHRSCEEIIDSLISNKLLLRYLSHGPEIVDNFTIANKKYFTEYLTNSLITSGRKNRSIDTLLSNIAE